MLLRNSMKRPRAAEYSTHDWDTVNRKFRNLFLSGEEYDTGRHGAERLSPVAAAHRILCNDFGMIPFSVYRKDGEERIPEHVSDLDTVFKIRPNDNMTPYMLGRTVMRMPFGMASVQYGIAETTVGTLWSVSPSRLTAAKF